MRLALAGLFGLFACLVSGSGAEPGGGTDAAGEPLPKGAKFRLGNGRLVFATQSYQAPFVLLGPDFKTFVHLNESGPVLRFDAATGAPVGKVPEKDKGVQRNPQLAVSADGKRVATVVTGGGGGVTVREVATGEVVKELKAPADLQLDVQATLGFATVAISADGKTAAAGGYSRGGRPQAVVWDVEKGEVAFHTETLPTGPPGVALSPDGKLLSTRGRVSNAPPGRPAPDAGREIQVWSVTDKKELFKAKPTVGGFAPAAMTFSPDGASFAAAFGDGLIDTWDVKTGKPRDPLLGRGGQGARLAFSPDGKTLAALSVSGAIERWNVADGKHLGTTEAPVSSADPTFFVSGLAFAGDARVVGWARHGPCPVAWEAPSGKWITQAPEFTAPVRSLAFAAGGKELLTSQDSGVRRWDAATGKPLGAVPFQLPRTGRDHALALSSDGTRAASLRFAYSVFDAATGLELFAVPQPARGTMSVLLAEDLKHGCVLTSDRDRGGPTQCAVWDLVGRKKIAEMEIAPARSYDVSAVVGPSGDRLVTVARSGPTGGKGTVTITGWDLKTGKKLGEVAEDATGPGSFGVAVADDTTAIVRSPNGRLRVLEYAAGRFGAEIEPEAKKADYYYGPIVFSADRKRFAAALPAGDGPWPHGVRVYEWPSCKPLATFTGHTATLSALRFSPDGTTLATASNDNTVVVWDLTASGK